MKKIFLIAVAMCLAATFSFAQKRTKDLPIATDKNYIVGKLDNGLTYYIRRNTNPVGIADFYIADNVGSLQEDESQRGLAHFLEHMAFNGTKNFPKQALRNTLAANSVRFGNNLNAYTSQDRTVYNIDAVPTKRASFVDTVILMLHDWSSFISCEPEEIEAERGVIREEWRMRDDVKSRMMKTIYNLDYAGSRFAERDPIGLMEVVNNFPPKVLVDYYHKWYRPDLQAIVIVGDIDPATIEASIKRIFSDIPAVKNGAKRETYKVDYAGKHQVGYFVDPETRAIAAKLDIRYPYFDDKFISTNEYLQQTLIREVISTAMNNRFIQERKEPDAATKRCVLAMDRLYYDCNIMRFTSVPVNNNYRKAMVALYKDAAQMLKYGFSEEEVAEAAAEVKGRYTRDIKGLYDPDSRTYVGIAVQNFTRKSPLFDTKAYADNNVKMLSELTAKDVNDYVKKIKYNNSVSVLVAPKSLEKILPTESELNAIRDSVNKSKVQPYVFKAAGKFVFSKNLKPVSVISTEKYAAVDSTTVFTLPGNTKVYWRETKPDVEKRVMMKAYRNGGLSVVKDDCIKRAKVAAGCMGAVVFGDLKRDEIAKLMSGKNMRLSPESHYREDAISGVFKVEDAEKFFQMLYAQVTDPQLDTEALSNTKKSSIASLELPKSELGKYIDTLDKVTYYPTPLQQEVKTQDVKDFTADMLMKYYKEHFSNRSGMTYIFSGPMSAKTVKPLIEKYIGNMPTGSENAKSNKGNYLLKGKRDFVFNAHDVKSTVCDVTVDATGFGEYSTKQIIAARFLCSALRDRYIQILREKMGGTYSVSVSPTYNTAPEKYLCVTVSYTAGAKNLDALNKAVYTEFDNVVKSGVTDEELETFRKFLNKSIKEKDYSRISWISRIEDNLTDGEYKDIDDLAIINAMTKEDVQDIAKNIFGQNNIFTQIYKPADDNKTADTK
jgi:zinc protease